jgi:tetratricopeptide (TPR) repeat protein
LKDELIGMPVSPSASRAAAFVFLLLVSGTVAVLAFPYLASAYHLEAAGRALDRPQRALQHLYRSIDWNSDNAQAFHMLATVQEGLDNLPAALEARKHYKQLRPRNPLGHIALAETYESMLARGEPTGIQNLEAQIASEWREAGYTAEAFVTLGNQAQAAGLNAEASVFYERAVHLSPDSEEIHHLLRQTSRGDLVAADLLATGGASAIQRVAWLRPGDLYTNYVLLKEAQEAGDEEGAATHIEKLVHFPLEAVHPYDERLLDYAGQVIPSLLREGLWDEAKTLNVLSFLVWQHSEAPGVERLLQRLEEEYPPQPVWPFYLGELYQRRGDLGRAETSYHRTLTLAPGFGQVYLRLGMVRETKARTTGTQADWEAAAHWFGQYREISPGDPLGLEQLVEVSQSLGRPETSMLREELETLTNCRQAIADLFGIPPDSVEFGSNLIENGGLAGWHETSLLHWSFIAHLGDEGKNGLSFTGSDTLYEEGGTARITTLWRRPLPDGSGAFAEYVGSPLSLDTGTFLFSVEYCADRLTEGIVLAYLGDYAHPGGPVLVHEELPALNGQCSAACFLVSQPSLVAQVMPLIRNWATGNLWIQEVRLRSVCHAGDRCQ